MTLEKINKVLDSETLEELNALTHEEVKARLVQAEQAIKEAHDELEANPRYNDLKAGLKAVREGYTGVKTRQSAIIAFALLRLEEDGAA